jgi:hypothetical protein
MSTFIRRAQCLGRIGAVAVACGVSSIAYALPLASGSHGLSSSDVRHQEDSTSPAAAHVSQAAASLDQPTSGTIRSDAVGRSLIVRANDGTTVTVTDAANDATMTTAASPAEPGTLGLIVAGLFGIAAIVQRRLRRDD